jgi:primary-amine oxidase
VRRGEYVRVWSLHHAGNYVYLVQWTFHDDGSLHPEVGLTGELYDTKRAHTHNNYWRFDFDLDGSADDLAQQITHTNNYPFPSLGSDLVMNFTSEAADTLYPLISLHHISRHWRVQDTQIHTGVGADDKIGYDLLPNPQGMFRGIPLFERYARDDFWVTRWHKCEMYATHNNTYMNTQGCKKWQLIFRKNVAQFTGPFPPAQNVNGQDIVLWYAVHVHHHPHREDLKQILLHPHGPTLRPHNLFGFNPTQP